MTIIIGFMNGILNLLYMFLKCLPVKDRILMMSRQSDEPSFEFEMLREEIQKQNHDVEVKFLCKTMGRSVDSNSLSILVNTASYGVHMLCQMYYLATSRVALLDSYIPAVSILHHRKSMKVVQMWHSMGTMKLFGWAILGNEEGSSIKIAKAMHMHQNYDYYFASSPAYQSHLARGFHCSEEKAKIFPLPRYDLLKSTTYRDKKREEISNCYLQLKNQKVIVYCPTFRKDESQMEEAVNELISYIPEGFQMVIKLHPFSKLHVKMQEEKNVIVDQKFSTMEMLFMADYVISDYSCVIYEAALLHIPLCFYNFDYGTYVETRGFAIDYEKELPGVISKDAETIMKAIKNHEFDEEEIIAFSKKYIVERDHVTQDIAQFLLDLCKECR